MKTNDEAYFRPALDIIQQVDPVTYSAIMADGDWDIAAVRDDDDLRDGISEILDFLRGALAITHISDDGMRTVRSEPGRWSDFNVAGIDADRRRLHVTRPDMLAAVIVHEYHHHKTDATEEEAWAATVEFTGKMRGPDAIPLQKLAREGYRENIGY